MGLDIVDDLRNHFRAVAFGLVVASLFSKSVNPIAQLAAGIMVLLVIRDAVMNVLNYRTGIQKYQNKLANVGEMGSGDPKIRTPDSKGKMIAAYFLETTLGRLGEFFIWIGLFGIVAQTGGTYVMLGLGVLLNVAHTVMLYKMGMLDLI